MRQSSPCFNIVKLFNYTLVGLLVFLPAKLLQASQGVRYLAGEYLKVVWAELSAIS